MSSTHNNEPQFDRLREILLPVLAEAAIGHFDKDVPYEKSGGRELNEVLMGVQMLLEVIRQQQRTMHETEEQLLDVRDRTTEILARVLDRSLADTPVETSRG
jgi:hypothetical protein